MASYADKYNTKLTPQEELLFNQWASANGRTGDSEDYDMRGAWKELVAGSIKQASNGHFPDTYKKPNHPTFSDQSKYHGVDNQYGGKWIETPQGTTFQVGPTQEQLWKPEDLQNYFKKREPDIQLSYPKVLTPDRMPIEDQDLYSRVNKAISNGSALYRDNYE